MVSGSVLERREKKINSHKNKIKLLRTAKCEIDLMEKILVCIFVFLYFSFFIYYYICKDIFVCNNDLMKY